MECWIPACAGMTMQERCHPRAGGDPVLLQIDSVSRRWAERLGRNDMETYLVIGCRLFVIGYRLSATGYLQYNTLYANTQNRHSCYYRRMGRRASRFFQSYPHRQSANIRFFEAQFPQRNLAGFGHFRRASMGRRRQQRGGPLEHGRREGRLSKLP